MFAKEASSKFKTRAVILILIGFVTMYCSGCFDADIINVVQTPITEQLNCTATQAVLGWTIGGYSVIALSFIFSTVIMKKGVRGFATFCFIIMAIGALLVGVGYNIGGGTGSGLIIVGGFLLKNFLQGLQLSVFQVVARWFNKSQGFILRLMGDAFALDNATSSTGLTFLYNGLGFTGMMVVAAVISQFFNSLTGMGVEMSTCMMYMMIFGLLGIVMPPIYGKIIDALGAPNAGVLCAALYIVAIAGFVFNIPVIAAAGLTFFVGAPVLQPALTIHVFGGKEYQAANRYLNIGTNLIAACGIPFMTVFYDVTGSYRMAYYVLLLMNVIVLLLMLTCRKTYADK